MYVKKEDLNKEREKLLPGITPEKGGNIDYENLKVMWGDKRLPITGNLKIDQEKKEKEKEKEKEESES